MTKRFTISLDEAIFVFGFFFSLFNSSLLAGITIIVPLLLIAVSRQKGALLAFILIQLRSILNPGIFAQYNGIATLAKWAIIFVLSFYLIITCYRKIDSLEIRDAIILVLAFSTEVIVSSFVVSSYPLISAFKVISYFLPFISILMGVYVENSANWTKKILIPLGLLLFSGVIVYNQPVGYYRNGYAFQGFISHPNVFGVMLALFVACYIHYYKKIKIKQTIVICASLMLAISSGSRTGMLSLFVGIIVFLLTLEMRRELRVVLIVLTVLMVIIIAFSSNASNTIVDLMFKGHKESLLYSRSNQIGSNIERFKSHPLVGTGFNVPYREGVRYWGFSFDMVVENGNLILALLADTGVIGLLLFVIAYFKIFKIGKGMLATIFIVPFVVSMGEMSFFSTNNFGIIMYFMIAIYAADAAWKNKFHRQLLRTKE